MMAGHQMYSLGAIPAGGFRSMLCSISEDSVPFLPLA